MLFYITSILVLVAVVLRAKGMLSLGSISLPSNIIQAKTVVLYLHCLCAVSSILVLIGASYLTDFSFRFVASLSCLLSSVVTIVSNYGPPSLSNYTIWLSNVSQGADFPFFMMSMIFLSKSLGMADYIAMLIISRRSLWFIFTHLSKNSSGWKAYAISDPRR